MKLTLPHSSSRRNEDTFIHRILDDQYVDWLLIVVISGILIVGFGLLGWNIYSDTDTRLGMAEQGNTAARSVFDETAMGKVLSNFDVRAAERDEVIRGYTGVSDPSL